MQERDPDFVVKAVAIIELQLNPPTDGPLFCAERAITDFIATYDAHHAHRFTWKKGVRFDQRLKDKPAANSAPATTNALAA